RHHHHQVGGRHFLEQRLGTAGEVAEPSLDRPALPSAWLILELDRGEERRPLPFPLRHALDHTFAGRIERHDLDDPLVWIGVIGPGTGPPRKTSCVLFRYPWPISAPAVRYTGLALPRCR